MFLTAKYYCRALFSFQVTQSGPKQFPRRLCEANVGGLVRAACGILVVSCNLIKVLSTFLFAR